MKVLSDLLNNMSSRCPASDVFTIYNDEKDNKYKHSLCLNNQDFNAFKKQIKKIIKDAKIVKISDHVILKTKEKPTKLLDIIGKNFNEISIVGYGKSIEIFKQVGNPKDVVERFNLKKLSGTHGIGNTRRETESAITTDGSHPYSNREDECLVHNE